MGAGDRSISKLSAELPSQAVADKTQALSTEPGQGSGGRRRDTDLRHAIYVVIVGPSTGDTQPCLDCALGTCLEHVVLNVLKMHFAFLMSPPAECFLSMYSSSIPNTATSAT